MAKEDRFEKLKFLLEVADEAPEACCALEKEKPHALALVKAGFLRDADETDPGCFALTVEAEQFLDEAERRLAGA